MNKSTILAHAAQEVRRDNHWSTRSRLAKRLVSPSAKVSQNFSSQCVIARASTDETIIKLSLSYSIQETTIKKNKNTFAKMMRERNKKRKAEEKRQRKLERKAMADAPTPDETLDNRNSGDEETAATGPTDNEE